MSKYPIATIRHTLAHVMAAAVQQLHPETKFGIGPVIENGFYYDFDTAHKFSEEDFAEIEKRMRAIIADALPVEQLHWPIDDGINAMRDAGQLYKVELLQEIQKGERPAVAAQDIEQQKDGKVSFYKIGEFIDLCKGPHVSNTKELPTDGFKLTHVAGAYWRGSEKNPQLQRIYAAVFATKKELDHYLWQREEAKKRDHRVLGQRLKLFTIVEEVGPGLPLWLPNGTIIREEIEKFAKEVETQWGYKRVATPHIAKEALYKMSGHIPYYADSMYPPMKLDDGNYYLKAMNCPHTHMIYRAEPRSYRDLPLRFAEYGTVYRYEPSGTLAGLLRVRGFTQNDAHIYCREDQVEEEFLKVMKLHEFWYHNIFGIKEFYMRLSLPTKEKTKYANIPSGWKKAVEMLDRIMKKSGLPYVEAEGEAAFYGPKVDFQIKSVIGREETASTNQLDFLATQRFNLTYKDRDGRDKPLYVIHRAPLGSHERFIAFLIEHYAGAFPAWLAPVQVAVLPISDKQNAYAQKVYAELKEAGLRAELNADNESIGKKIRQAELMKVPYLLVVGEKELKAKKVAVRKRGEGDIGQTTLKKFVVQLQKEITAKA